MREGQNKDQSVDASGKHQEDGRSQSGNRENPEKDFRVSVEEDQSGKLVEKDDGKEDEEEVNNHKLESMTLMELRKLKEDVMELYGAGSFEKDFL